MDGKLELSVVMPCLNEADTVGITRPCTKHNWLVKDTNKLSGAIHEAFHVATAGRPGPGAAFAREGPGA